MNHYLRPLVKELNDLYLGVKMLTSDHPEDPVTVRAALLNVACDIPAARKVSGFTSHNSTRACYKCDRTFTTFQGTTHIDYSGFDWRYWQLTTYQQAVNSARIWLTAKSASEQANMERQTGVRWTELYNLPYFDPVRSTIVDPMHNLFLRTTKRMVEFWVENGYISKQ